jgi:hypothetical protein
MLLKHKRHALKVAPLPPTNLRLYPADMTFHGDIFKELVTNDERGAWIMQTIDGGVDAWIPLPKTGIRTNYRCLQRDSPLARENINTCTD